MKDRESKKAMKKKACLEEKEIHKFGVKSMAQTASL